MLKLIVKSANDLTDVDFGSSNKSDPYVKAVFRGDERKTDYIKDELNPVWTAEHHNEFVWELGADPILLSDEILVKVRDWEQFLIRRLLGQVVIPLKDLLKTKKYTIEQSYTLLDSYKRPLLSTILLRIEYTPSQATLTYMSDDALDVDDQLQDDDEETDEDETDEHGKPRRKKRRKNPIRKARREWSTLKRHYKITIKIHKGRQLSGTNISPVVRVTVKSHKQETRVKRSTNSPDYNQTFTFNFHCSEAELFEELIILEVFNSRKVFRNSLIGFFESNIGVIYEFPGHAIIRKWVLLTGSGLQDDDDDDEPNGLSKWLRRRGRDGGTAGYLKVTVNVIAAGDEPLSLKQLAKTEDEDDIESNCLMPVGVTRESAEFCLKVYLAEDLPQMDAGFATSFRNLFLPGHSREDSSERKKLVDPFLVFSFSGKEVKTSVKYKQNNPTFNEILKLPFLYPTMCERLKFQLYDKDRGNKNDIISTSFLSLSEISGKDYSSAFLPHFGPCYINFYGSPREYHVFRPEEFDTLNKGIGEGVAYRGRALVELTQEKSNGESRPSVNNIHAEDIIRVQPYLRQEKYKLFACFKNAAMISKIDKAIEFEVSIGNFGNILDETEVTCNTPPTNPVYDGCHYHYLPWQHYKPCICLNCNWENIAFRIEPLNTINKLCEHLDSKINKLKDDLEHVEGEDTHNVLVRQCLQEVIEKCKNTKFLKLAGQKNTLDHRLSKLRQDEFVFIAQEAINWINKLVSPEQSVKFDLEKIVEDMEDYVVRLKSLAFEPQISIPDVIIWMLCGGSKIAYHRVPIQDVIYSPNKDARGKHCGKTIELLMKYPGKTKFDKEYHEVPAMVRVELWVGLRQYQHKWTERDAQKGEGKFEIYAETYENQIKALLGRWSNPTLSMRPHFSNASGDVRLKKEKFVVPSKGWTFKGDWKTVLDRSLLYDRDWGLINYADEIYDHQSRNLLGGEWNEQSIWTEEDGQPSRGIEDFQLREGWRWTMDDWQVDQDRAVDADGWEYCVSEGLGGTYVKAAKPLHMTRRRRWYRTRELVDATQEMEKDQERIQKLVQDGWEYAASFQSKFHIKPRSRDFVRRKRLLKEIVQDDKELELPPKLAISTKIKRHKTKKDKKSKEKSETDSGTEEQESKGEKMKGLLAVLPRMFVVYEKPRLFQLWVYIYQARDLLAMDDSGRSDPYVRVAFCNQSQKTERAHQTLSPKWDQTLVFPQVEIFETIENVERSPPNIIMEAFDRDLVGKHDFIGRCMIQPVVQIEETGSPPTLTWVTLYNGQTNAGQILAAAELFLDEGQRLPALPKPKPSKTSHYIYPVRYYLRPQLQTVAVEILCWGVRNMKTFNHFNVDRPSVEFEWGDRIFYSQTLENAKKNPNFDKPNLTREIVDLEEEPFTPPMSVRVYDNRAFKQRPLVGVISISTLEMSKLQPLNETSDYEEPMSPFSPLKVTRTRTIEEHKKEREEFDWWSKYHYSMSRASKRRIKSESMISSMFGSSEDETAKDHLDIYEEKKHDSLEIFQCELEDVKRFEGLNDFVSTLELKRGKWTGNEEDEDDSVGELKASIRVYQVKSKDVKLPKGMFDDLSEIKMKWPMKFIVRVYVICAFDLQPHDPSGLADPYLIVSLGDKTKNDKENVQHNTLEPQFGRMFEFNASIPLAKDLKITIMDSDPGFDDLIGETTIDLEQRLLSRFHASCGLPKTYLVGGPFPWRDSLRPKDILRTYCLAKGYHPYFYPKGMSPNTLVLKVTPSRPGAQDITCKLAEIEDYDPDRPNAGSVDQQLSLYALHRLGLVPEHVETRSLYSSIQPGIEQGKVHLWVDIFPKTGDGNIKPPIEIKPRTPQPYVLRVIIWDTTNVELQETAITGEKMSDIYVKGWIQDVDDKQKTDVHYRSLSGDGNFNWRMSFPLMIMPITKKLDISKKEKFYHMHETSQKVDPILKIQIWENDKFSPDDFLGTRSIRLNDLVRPCKSSKYCGTKSDPNTRRQRPDDFVDLFHGGSKSLRGWFACWKDESQPSAKPTGKVDMSIEILTEVQAKANPAGLGREEPNQHPHLPEPDRPKTSFLWFMSPFKSMRYIVWRNYKWQIIAFIITVFLVLLILFFVYNLPGYSVKKLIGA